MAGRPKGIPKTGGRKKGTPNKTTAQVKDAILKAFDQAGGAKYLLKVSEDDPRTFCTLLAKVLPAEIKAELTGPDGDTIRVELVERIIHKS